MASSPKSRGLGNISPIVNRSGITSPVKKPVAKMPVPKPVTTTFAQRKAAPSPFRSQAKPMAKVNPLQQAMQPKPRTDIPPGAQMRMPVERSQPSQPMMPPSSGLNQMQQDYFKYRNSQRDIEEQNEKASQAYYNQRSQAINDAGYGTGSAQYGHYDERKDAAALQFIRDYDYANPMAKQQEYDMGYDDFQSYAEKKLGFNPNDPNNPNSVNGYANMDLGLMDVRGDPGMLMYVPRREGYQDKQGNYYDTRGNPMARPKFLDEEANNRNGMDPFGGMFGGPQKIGGAFGRPIFGGPPTGGMDPVFGGPMSSGETSEVINQGMNMQFGNPNPMDFVQASERQMNTIGIAPPNPFMGGPYKSRPDLGPNVGFGAGLPNPQDNNNYNTGGFMDDGGSMFGGGGFAGK